MKNNKKKGFTLMEMLIVVAIIAILVAITIPVLNSSLEKAREAADAANLRAAYAEASIKALETSKTATASAIITQSTAGWVTSGLKIAGTDPSTDDTLKTVKSADVVIVTVTDSGTVSFAKQQ